MREQCDKQKRSVKRLEERVGQLSERKKFNPAEAFSQSRKENTPLAVIDGKLLVTMARNVVRGRARLIPDTVDLYHG